MATQLVDDETVTYRYAGIRARPALRRLLADAAKYPRSYDRERVEEKANAILDAALDEAVAAVASTPRCVVCSDTGCSYCPKA